MTFKVSPGPKLDINKANTHILPPFTLIEPGSLKELLEVKAKYGEKAAILAGGTDLLVKIKLRVLEPEYVISLKKVRSELSGIRREGDEIVIGAATLLRDIELNDSILKLAPALFDAVIVMGGVQIRNMGTIGGNLGNASPAADTAPPLLVHSASVKLLSASGERVVPLEEFFTGPGRTVMRSDEIIYEVRLKPLGKGCGSAFMKIARTAFDLAKISAAAMICVEDGVIKEAKVAVGSAAPTPVRARSAEEALVGKAPTPETFLEAGKAARNDISPIDDVRSTAWYRRRVIAPLLHDVLQKALGRIGV